MMTTGPKLIPVSVEIAQNELEWKAPFLHFKERRDIFRPFKFFQDSTSIAEVAGVEREKW